MADSPIRPSLVELCRVTSNGSVDPTELVRSISSSSSPVQPPKRGELDRVSSKITVTYLPVVNALIAEDTRRLLVENPASGTIGGVQLIREFGQSLLSLRDIKDKLQQYRYRSNQAVSTDLTHLLHCTRMAMAGIDSDDLTQYMEHLYSYFRKMELAINDKPALLELIDKPFYQALNMFDPKLFLAERRMQIQQAFGVNNLKEKMLELQTKVEEFKEAIQLNPPVQAQPITYRNQAPPPMYNPFGGKRLHLSSSEEEEEDQDDQEEEAPTPISPQKKKNICRGPPPKMTESEKMASSFAMMHHIPTLALTKAKEHIEKKPRKRAFSENEKIEIGKLVSELKPEFSAQLMCILAKDAARNGGQGQVEEDDDYLQVNMDKVSIAGLYEIQQYAKQVKNLTKERGKPGRKPKPKVPVNQ